MRNTDVDNDDTTPKAERCKCCNSVLRPPHLPHKPAPFLLLHGAWMTHMGIAVGSRVRVDGCPGQITITLVGPPRRVRSVIPDGPTGEVRHVHYVDVHADPIPPMPSAA